jgi:hypothetical protein
LKPATSLIKKLKIKNHEKQKPFKTPSSPSLKQKQTNTNSSTLKKKLNKKKNYNAKNQQTMRIKNT